jgi:ribosomal protein S18 acetylase RimI-like enzyme
MGNMSTQPSINFRAVNHRVEPVAKAIHRVQMLAYAQEAALLGVSHFHPLLATVNDVLNSDEQYFAAFEGEKLVGVISTEADDSIDGRTITSLVVDPSFQRRSIATNLIPLIIEVHGSKSLAVQTGAKNIPALNLYRQMGFVETRRFQAAEQPLELVELRRHSVLT